MSLSRDGPRGRAHKPAFPQTDGIYTRNAPPRGKPMGRQGLQEPDRRCDCRIGRHRVHWHRTGQSVRGKEHLYINIGCGCGCGCGCVCVQPRCSMVSPMALTRPSAWLVHPAGAAGIAFVTKLGATFVTYRKSQMIASLPIFQNGANNRDLRCVLQGISIPFYLNQMILQGLQKGGPLFSPA